MNNIQDLLKAYQQEEEPMMSTMAPADYENMQSPVTNDMMFTEPQASDIPAIQQQPQTPIVAQAEAPQPQAPETPEKPESELDRLERMLQEARRSDRALKVGGAIGDALATVINARSQMNVKAPGVQVQQGAGLGKVADMFATAPEIQSDLAARREAMLKQYAELAKGERSQARLTSEEKRANERMAQQERLAKAENEAMLKAAGIRASGKGELTPYQEKQIERQEKQEAKLSDKQTKEVEGLDNVLSSLNEVESAKTGVNTGRYAAAGQKAIDLIPGMEADQDFVALRQMSGTQLFDYVKEQSGVSYSVKELEELKNNMPNVEDDDKTFITKLNTVRKIVERKRQNKLSAFEKQGKNVKEFKQEQSAKKPVAGDIVNVKGKKYKVAEDGDTLIPVGQ